MGGRDGPRMQRAGCHRSAATIRFVPAAQTRPHVRGRGAVPTPSVRLRAGTLALLPCIARPRTPSRGAARACGGAAPRPAGDALARCGPAQRILKYTGCSPCNLAVAIIYLRRYATAAGTPLRLTSHNIQRLLLTAAMLASKFLDEPHSSNKQVRRRAARPCRHVAMSRASVARGARCVLPLHARSLLLTPLTASAVGLDGRPGHGGDECSRARNAVDAQVFAQRVTRRLRRVRRRPPRDPPHN